MSLAETEAKKLNLRNYLYNHSPAGIYLLPETARLHTFQKHRLFHFHISVHQKVALL
jgi:hypothetical protein